MQTTDLNPRTIAASAANIPENKPFFMLNLLRYRQRALYQDRPEFAHLSGREAYFQNYVPAFNQIAGSDESTKDIRPAFVGSVLARLVGPPGEHWDDVAIVQYPSYAAFRRIAESPEYKRDADPHRQAALEDWRLIALKKLEF